MPSPDNQAAQVARLSRRTILALLAGGCASTTGVGRGGPTERVIAAHGGRSALSSVERLHWTGVATVETDKGELAIHVDTWWHRDGRVRSSSYPVAQGPAAVRHMMIDQGGGRIERGDSVQPMSPAMLTHEQDQFGIYAWLLLHPLLTGQSTVVPVGDSGVAAAAFSAATSADSVPSTELLFDDNYHLIAARHRVRNHVADAPAIDQLFRFSGALAGLPVRWPKSYDIEQNGKAYFRMMFDSLALNPPWPV